MRAIQVHVADPDSIKLSIQLQRRDGSEDEPLESLDEAPVVDARSGDRDACARGSAESQGRLRRGSGRRQRALAAAAAVSHHQVHRPQARLAGCERGGGGLDGGLEEVGAHAPGEGEGFELREAGAQAAAEVVALAELGDFGGGQGLLAVEAFHVEVEVRDGCREPGVLEDGV